MRNYLNRVIVILFVWSLFLPASSLGDDESLAELYKKGKVTLSKVMTIKNDAMPEEVVFEAPLDMAIDEEGNIYLLDMKACHIKVFDSRGKFIRIIGREGQGPGEFSSPSKIAVLNDKIYVSDGGLFKLLILDKDGKEIRKHFIKTRVKGYINKMKGSSSGELWIEFDNSNMKEPEKPQESSIEIYSSNLNTSRPVFRQDYWRMKYLPPPPGGRGIPYPFSPRVHWDILPDGSLAVGYSKEYNIQIFSPSGEKIDSFFHEYKPIRVQEKDKEQHASDVGYVVNGIFKTGFPPDIAKHVKYPKYFPAFYRVKTDYEGNILVFFYTKESENNCFDAFTSEGKFIAQVEIIDDKSQHSIFAGMYVGKDGFWIWEFDDKGNTELRKYKLN